MTVILAGDLNNQPDYARLDKWYSSSPNTPYNSANYGSYRELDDTDTRCAGYGEVTVDNGGPCGLGRKMTSSSYERIALPGRTPVTRSPSPPCVTATVPTIGS